MRGQRQPTTTDPHAPRRLRDELDERAARTIAPFLNRCRPLELEALVHDPELTAEQRQAARRVRAAVLRAWRIEDVLRQEGVQ